MTPVSETRLYSNFVISVSKARLPTKAKLATREKLAGEIKPVSAENSRTSNDDEEKYAAAFSIDRDLSTTTSVAPGTDGKSWHQVKLGKVYCVHQVIWFDNYGERSVTWTCTETDCSTCTEICMFGSCNCNFFTLTVKSVGATPNNLKPGCKYGDTVRLESSDTFVVWDIAITVKQGICHDCVLL